MWPITNRTLMSPSVWSDLPDVLDVVFRGPYEDEFLDSLIGTPNDKIFAIKVYVGNYTTDDVKWKVEGNKLKVTGRHIKKTKYGEDRSEFDREFDLPANVLKDTLRHYVTSDGVLVIEGKRHIDVRYPYQDLSDKDRLEVVLDVEGYTDDEVTVSIHKRNIVVECHRTTEKKTAKGEKIQSKSFKRVITVPTDVDETTIDVSRKKDDYLTIKAKRNPQHTLAGPKRLTIKRE